ncbi:hypothetical protein [Streptomyces sp. NBC_00102]|uniref:hypothetical protein n=1 Tax=Streptomyces sp. NBC_00102 TaxID=2975652 RepID=UPI00225195EB|nr:hypothetical protein [Streptomyces sp. NBC_00102]MCX5399326.1 hypothetical protein [Streptomyces sp. NBC_00102]
MARHARSKPSRHVLLRAGLTVGALGAALGAGTASAQAAAPPAVTEAGDSAEAAVSAVTDAALPALTGALSNSLAPVTALQLDPLAKTGTDPLDNAVGTQVADFKPVSTALVTDHLTDGGALRDLPLIGPVTGLITGAH